MSDRTVIGVVLAWYGWLSMQLDEARKKERR